MNLLDKIYLTYMIISFILMWVGLYLGLGKSENKIGDILFIQFPINIIASFFIGAILKILMG